MSKRILIFSLIVSFSIMTTSLFGTFSLQTVLNLSNQRDNTLNAFSGPKTSAAKVTEKWNYQTPDYVRHVAISSDGNYIAATYGKNITLFHRDSNVALWEFEAADTINDVAISWNGTYIVACCMGYAYLLNSSEENPKTTMWNFTKVGNPIKYCVDISWDGMYIAVGIANDGDGAYLLNNSYSSQNKKEVWQQEWPGGPVGTPQSHSITISGDGNYTISGDRNVGWVTVYNETKINPKKYEWRYDTTALIKDVEISHTGDYFLASNDASEVYLFNTTDYQGIPVWNFSKPGFAVNDIAISADGKYSVVCFAGILYYLNNTFLSVSSQKEPLWEWNGGSISDVDISGDGKYIVVATSGLGTIYLLNNETTTSKSPQWTGLSDVELRSVAIDGLGDYFVTGTYVPGGPDHVYLFHHDISIPTILLGGREDDDDDDDDVPAIPLGWYYLLFFMIGIISSIFIMKRKLITSKIKF